VEVAVAISAVAEGISAEVEGISEASEGVTSAAATLVAGISAAATLAVAISVAVTLAAATLVAGTLVVTTLAVATLAVTLAATTLVVVGLVAESSEAVASPREAATLVAEGVSIATHSAIKSGGIALVEPEALVESGGMTGALVGAGGAVGRDRYFGPISSATSSRLRSGPITTILSGRTVSALTLIIAVTCLTTYTADWATYTATYMALIHMGMDMETIDAIRTVAVVSFRAIQMRSCPM